MIFFIAKRLLTAVPVLLCIAAMTFCLVRLAPGGPFSSERQVSPEVLRAMEAHYGLNDPWPEQFGHYLWNVLHGDFGPSYTYPGRTVGELIKAGFPVSFELGLIALLLSLAIGIPLGLVAALKKNEWPDHGSMVIAMVGICLPSFVLGPFLALFFGLKLGWFHVSGWYTFGDKVLPSITLAFFYTAYVARIMRASMLEVLNQPYIRTARAKGASETRVVLVHALKGSLLPVLVFLGPAAAGLVSGSFVVETIFQVPGLGRHFVNAAFNRDYTVMMGLVLFYGALIVAFNCAVDVLQALLNPKLRIRN
jgi:oligopeptide transport system permease protein